MDCKNCGTPNPEDAVYCKKCGKRLDGMDVCPACGKLTPADGDFCINCGANKSAPPARVAAGPAPAPVFLSPARGGAGDAPMQEAAAAAVDVAGEESPEDGTFVFEKHRGILKKVSSLCAALTALMGIIFVFLIDFSVTISTSVGGTSASASASSGYDIFYFFGDAYDAITSGLSSYEENALTSGTVFGTLCCVVGMAVTIICFLAAVLRMFKRHGGNTEKSLIAPCAATFISFVCTAVLFMMCIVQKASESGYEAAYTLGGAAIAGIVLGAIFLAVSVATDVMANIKRENLRPSALNGIFSAAMVIFGFVALGIMAGGIVSYVADTDLLGSVEYTYGAYSLFAGGIYSIASTLSSRGSNSDFTDMYSTELALVIVLVIAAVAFCIFLTAALSKIVAGRGGDISSKVIRSVVLAGLCAVICGGMMLGCTLVFVDYLGSDYYEASLVAPIVVIVFGVLLAAVALAYKNRYKISALSPYLS